MDENREKKLCKYCAEEIFIEAKVCRYCGKIQENISSKISEGLDEIKEKNKMNSTYWLIIWIPSIALMLFSIFMMFFSAINSYSVSFIIFIPAIIGAIYWTYMYNKYIE
jgi:uncharacterized membrane protein YvbJ